MAPDKKCMHSNALLYTHPTCNSTTDGVGKKLLYTNNIIIQPVSTFIQWFTKLSVTTNTTILFHKYHIVPMSTAVDVM